MSEPRFIPKDGQVDYTNIRYCPVINCVVRCGEEILLQQRSPEMRLYPNYWSGVSGFLDTNEDIQEKIHEELIEELGIQKDQVISIEVGQVVIQEAPKYGKTWIVFPVLVSIAEKVKTTENWEVAKTRWLSPKSAKKLNLLPGFEAVLKTFFDI